MTMEGYESLVMRIYSLIIYKLFCIRYDYSLSVLESIIES